MGEVLLSSDAVVVSRGPALFRHVGWLELDIATDREPRSIDHNEIAYNYINDTRD